MNMYDGYVLSNEDNLIDSFPNWSEIKSELSNGSGSELNGKFNAVYSSSALCVNNFAPFKLYKDNISILGFSNFIEASFEKKLPTSLGGTPPNLDFYLETQYEIIGIESKFLETIDEKAPNKNSNFAPYLKNISKLFYLPEGFIELIKQYDSDDKKRQLDIAQLLKHSIGIIHRCKTKYEFFLNSMFTKPVLVYIYWQPQNWFNVDIYCNHENEIIQFSDEIRKFITFIPISYLEFWKVYENDRRFSEHIGKMKERYLITI
ncbi:MAG: hypothetical protein Q8L04_12860, partial [Ignavibacteria bacterium]|nr:hypothetical protein [Ignavibacteria bacterium]